MARVEMERVIADGRERMRRLREKALCSPAICIERGYLVTESYKETEAEPTPIRRAKALQKILQGMTIRIEDEELIVGWATTKQRGGALVPEAQWKWYLEEMDALSTRERDRFAPVAEEEKAKMREFLPYWKGKSLYEKWHAMLPENVIKLKSVIGSPSGSLGTSLTAHACPDFERVVAKGLNDIKKQVNAELDKLNLSHMQDLEKFQFLNAVNIALEAATSFAGRYAELARSMAKKETNAPRRSELQTIAEICSRVPAEPARNFYEALQSIWFTYTILMMEAWGIGLSIGRPDQYLYQLYKKDLEEGKITREEARALIGLLYIKLNGMVVALGTENVDRHAGFPLHANITLGGLNRDGRDAVNDLSYLFLEAEDDVRLSAEDFVIRIHKNTPDAFLMKACETTKLLGGKLKFLSDETVIQQLLSDGKPVEYARDYVILGCNDSNVPGLSHDLLGPKLNVALMLELALNNGVSRLTGKQIGPKTGDPRNFRSYDEVWDAYKKQVEAALPVLMVWRNASRKLRAEFTPQPFQSSLFHGCLEKGLDIGNGGTAPYEAQYTALSGVPNVGDSFAAIKKAVFEDKRLTMERLIDALDNNFENDAEILHILKRAPKFGNDDDFVDLLVNNVIVHGSQEVAKYKGFAGAISNTCAGIVTSNVPMGSKVGALPDGRRAGEPLAEGGISPHQGRNVSGPTATMRSVSKLDLVKLTGGSVLNMRFSPEALQDESKTRKFASLIRTFCETGGFLVQFNIVGTDTLKDAQRHPEKYRDLLIRVATYSAYFVELSPVLQNDIIARLEFREV